MVEARSAGMFDNLTQGNIDLNGESDTDDKVMHATRLTDRNLNGRFDFFEESARPVR